MGIKEDIKGGYECLMVRERERERGWVKRREGGRVGGGRVEYSAQRSDEGWRKKGERRYTHI